ncbi:MAG: pyroglutamyl-peptidase I [Vulcanimicrobiaceae bacterium]
MAKHVLITGFEPFGGDKINPSELVVRSLEGRLISGRLIVTRILPVETRPLRDRLEEAIRLDSPDLILCTGVAAGRSSIALERVAVNVLDFTQADNVGVMRKNDPILRGGPEARISNLPFERIVDAWTENGVPGYVSNSAGTYICNQALYETLSLTENASPPVLVGFVHFPYLPAQAIEAGAENHPSMSFDLMKKSMEILIEVVVPWIEHRQPERDRAPAASQMWIPRGVKEVER